MTAADVLVVSALAVAAASLLGLVVSAVAARRARAHHREALAAVRVELTALREQVEQVEAAPGRRPASGVDGEAAATAAPASYVITGVGERRDDHGSPVAGTAPGAAPGRIEGRLFADLVLRESVVKAAALAHGVRRAAAPESRDRIRAEMRREVRRSRKQRRADLREARRRIHAEQRAGLAAGEDAA